MNRGVWTHFIRVCIFALIALSAAMPALAQMKCGDVFTSAGGSAMADQTSIHKTIQNLAQLRLMLDIAHLEGRSSPEITALNYDYEVKEKELIEYFEKYKIMTKEQLLEKMRVEIERIQAAQAVDRESLKEEEKKKEEQRKEIENHAIDGSRIIMNPIKPGKFMMGEVGKQVETEITKPFEMAATQTTQIVWRKIVETAQKRFPGQYNELELNPSKSQGDLRPVESISYNDIHLWLKAANALIAADDPVIAEVIPETTKGSVLRLPTEAEWEFVARMRGSAQGHYHFGDDESDLEKYAWYRENAESKTHPVAQKLPLRIEGREFYDMHGNVWEWTDDANQANLFGGVDPHVKGDASSVRVVRGGSWYYGARYLRAGSRDYWRPEDRNAVVGFRLVRTSL